MSVLDSIVAGGSSLAGQVATWKTEGAPAREYRRRASAVA